MTELDTTAVAHKLFVAAGSRLFDSCLTEFERLSDVGCDLLFAVRDGPGDVPNRRITGLGCDCRYGRNTRSRASA